MDGDLDARVRTILLAVVDSYIHTGEPVGSRTLSKMLALGLSAATIRNVMADLTELGYLEQPHTSAGRVPTDQAYRYYVDASGAQVAALPEAVKLTIDEAIADSATGLESLLSRTTKLLSELTDFTGVVASPQVQANRLKMLEFLRISPQQVIVVLITHSNMVHNKILRVSEDMNQEFLNTVSRYLNEQFSQKSLGEIRDQVLTSLLEEKEQYDQLLAQVVRLGKRAFDLSNARELYVEGQFHIVKQLQDIPKIQALLQALEKKFAIIELLDQTLSAAGVNIVIGQENKMDYLEDCALVTATYGTARDSLGAIGVIGPTRMDYLRVIPIIDYTAKVLSTAIASQAPG
ncbi:MAG TPA: heat-inducible transcriptional repressor HrcA [bacterium]|nr:heat-inducible transcriptional repressor HrcA [bacterium]